MTWQTFVFIPVALVAFAWSGRRLKTVIDLIRAHGGNAHRLDRLPERFASAAIDVFGQRQVLRRRGPGIMHTTIFWGFIIISLGTLEQFATTIHRGATFEIIGEVPYRILVFLQDFFSVAVLLAVFYACYRRFVVRPKGLGKSRDANLVLAFTGGLMGAILLMNGFHLLAASPWYQGSMPFSSAMADLLAGLGFQTEVNAGLGTFWKWVHILLVLGFAVYIPGSKHLHILASAPNSFLRTLDRAKPMRPINFEDESVTQYGAAKVTDLTWKDALDLFTCTECGRCQDVCPAYDTQKPLTPKMLILDLKENLYRNKAAVISGTKDGITPAIDENVTEDVIWSCTTCRACEIACPVYIEHTDKIMDIRRNLVLMESKFPQEVQTVFKNMETNATPWAFAASDRASWSEGLNIPTVAENPSPEVLVWVGCAGSFDERNKKVLRAFCSVLKKAGVHFAILGSEEQCTGDPARRIGNEYLFQTLAKANVETLNRHKIQRIVTACPHCFNTIKNEYKQFGGSYEVFHHSEYLSRLISEGRIKPSKGVDQTVTYHDSCYLGRWNGVYGEPRSVVGSLPGIRVVEMKSSGEESLCCGAGGGRMWMEEKIGKRINVARTEQALATKAGVVATACPFCMTMLTDGVKSKEMQDKVKVTDIAELIDTATP